MSQRIHLDATPGLFHQVLHCHQGDVGRQFEIAVVTRDGYEIPSGATFKIQATKPSGLGFTVTGTAANNIISFTSTEDMTSEAGEIPTQLEIKSGNDVIYTSNFLLVCEKNTHPASITDGSPEEIISEITLLVERAESAASTAGADAAAAAQARVDEMMDYLPSEVADLKSDLSDETSARILLAGRVTTAESDIDTLETHKVAQPLDGNNQPTNGTSGQSLRTKGDGTTEWADVGLPTDGQTAQAVSDWLDDHPEATTTVQDGSLTEAKLSETLKLKVIKDYVTPEMFGAKGDGTTDDTTAFVNALAENDYLFIPPKTYKISQVALSHGKHIFGAGTIVINGNGFVFSCPTEQKSFDGLTFEIGSTSHCCIKTTGSSDDTAKATLTITNCTFKGVADSQIVAVEIGADTDAKVLNCNFNYCSLKIINSINPIVSDSIFKGGYYGIFNANTDSTAGRAPYACGLRVTSCTILGCVIGIKAVQVDSIQIVGCMIDYNDYPIVILGTPAPNIDNCYISARDGNTAIYIANNNSNSGVFGGNGLTTEPCYDVKIANTVAYQHSEALDNETIVIKNCNWITIHDVSVNYSGKAAIGLHDVTGVNVVDCMFRSGISGSMAILAYKSGALGDDSTHFYKNLYTSLPIYVKYARAEVYTSKYIREASGSELVPADTTDFNINTGMANGIDYVFVTAQDPSFTATYYNDNPSTGYIRFITSSHSSAKRLNWRAIGKANYLKFSMDGNGNVTYTD